MAKIVRNLRFMAGSYAVRTAPYKSLYGGHPFLMNSTERREQRYLRRKAKRDMKILQRSLAQGSFEEVFSFRHLYLSGKKCCKNVLWKNSSQRFIGTLLLMVAEIREQLMSGTFRGKGFIHFVVMERGKLRHIRSVHITERMVQKCLCDYCIVPIYSA